MSAVLAWSRDERPDRRSDAARAAAADLAARDWLETQARVVGFWRDLLLESGGDPELVAALDEHAAFLARRGRRRGIRESASGSGERRIPACGSTAADEDIAPALGPVRA